MKFEIYSTSGKMADYISTLAKNGYKLSGDGLYEMFIEIDSLVQLRELTHLLNHEIVLLRHIADSEYPAIEIYDDYRE
jgi:hypothetical protein